MNQKRYNSINDALKKRFGCKVFKVSLNSGCSCPNRDGSVGTQGCAFCGEKSYQVVTKPFGEKQNPQSEVLRQGIDYVRKRHQAAKFISYFQSGSNTNGPPERLRKIFEASIDHPQVVGLAIATRPDCISEAHIDLLADLSKKTMLSVEMGLQSAHDKTLKLINRGHSAEDFAVSVDRLKKRNISVCAHVILGLPHENINDMLSTANFLNELKVDGVKIHNLHILKETLFEEWYKTGHLQVCDLHTYATWAADFLEHLDPNILIHRLNGHAPRHLTVAPSWSVNKLAIFNAVEKELKERDAWQGKKFNDS